MRRASGDSRRTFERLYRSHVRDVYRYALVVMRNPEDAEDVAQTTFMKAFRVLEAGERPRNARSWLITIAHNTCSTRMRDARRRPQEVALDERLASSGGLGETDVVRPRELLSALAALTFNQRAALVMRELEGRSYAEIAELLELSPSAVETLLFRARRALREQLDGTLACGDAERGLSLDLDGRLDRAGRAGLRAHLRSCPECAGLARRRRARRAALAALGPVPLPASLASWGGGAVAGTGVAAKVAAVVAAGAAVGGVALGGSGAVVDPAPHDRTAAAPVATAQPASAYAVAPRPDARASATLAPGRKPRTAPATTAHKPSTTASTEGATPAAAPTSVEAFADLMPQFPPPQPLPEPPPVSVDVPELPAAPIPTLPDTSLPVDPPPLPPLPTLP